ncbi:MBL fold metallo-hydrolase [Mariniflexile soesokkakense]|uniref:MBL fold metallo-hydrolase n=1 Tax=Mariniflexile soesokkakense TaxID=1343160 RepID=A0ABV0AD07_9FLAO
MELQLIRNATLKLDYGGMVFLIDPYLGEKYSQPTFAGISKNPTTNLPISIKEILNGVNTVLVSHLHPDHFDEKAEKVIPKSQQILCQPEDVKAMTYKGFTDIQALETEWTLDDITITRTTGQHGHGDRLFMMGNVSGYIFQHKDEPTLYWMGDTVWYNEVQKIIEKLQPSIIVTHSCGAVWVRDEEPVIMDEKQTVAVCEFAPYAQIVATHMESLDLATISRLHLRTFANQKGISDSQLLIPIDGEKMTFNK